MADSIDAIVRGLHGAQAWRAQKRSSELGGRGSSATLASVAERLKGALFPCGWDRPTCGRKRRLLRHYTLDAALHALLAQAG
jgi:hypothetical protein